MSISIRVAEAADLAQVGDVAVAAYVADGLLDADHIYLDRLRAAAERAEAATVLVAVEDERVLGTITLAHAGTHYAEIAEEGEVELRMLAVAPDARGRGIGELLLRAAIERGIGWGARRVVLSTMPVMGAARRIYDRLGLVRLPERDWDIPGHTMQVYATQGAVVPNGGYAGDGG